MKTITIGWLNKCRCGNKSLTVKTAHGNETALWDDDAVKCNSCGREGVIQVCEGQARVLWETNEEMAERKPMTFTKEQLTGIIESADDVLQALAGTHDDIHPDSDKMCAAWNYLNDNAAPPAVVKRLAEIALAALTVEPFLDRDQVRREHAEWSQSTFGAVGPIGPLKHLSKEALEAAAEPDDLSEWADMQFLLWDAQRRAGITDEQITLAMIDKLAVNKARTWPEPKDGEPRLHINAAPQRKMNKAELLQKISVLATECHAQASEIDIGKERTEMFEIYGVLRNLGRRGYASQVGRRMNPLLASCDEDEDDD